MHTDTNECVYTYFFFKNDCLYTINILSKVIIRNRTKGFSILC
jgi:hypothetical protein